MKKLTIEADDNSTAAKDDDDSKDYLEKAEDLAARNKKEQKDTITDADKEAEKVKDELHKYVVNEKIHGPKTSALATVVPKDETESQKAFNSASLDSYNELHQGNVRFSQVSLHIWEIYRYWCYKDGIEMYINKLFKFL